MIECFLTNLYSIDVMAPFCLEMQKRGYQCHMALDELFWKVSYGEHFDIQKAIQKAKSWGVKLNLRLNYDIDIAVTQWRVDWALFGLYKNLKAKISYGLGLNKIANVTYSEKLFDYYFIHGDFEKKILLENGIDKKRITKIGFPKLKYQKINFKISKTKPIITYLATWDKFKKINLVIPKLKALKDYDIYVKPHPLQSIEDIKFLNKYFNVLDKSVTIKSVVEFSDIIVGDLKTASLFDVIYYKPDMPIIAVGTSDELDLYYDLYKDFDLLVLDDESIDINKLKHKNKIKLRNYCFNEDWVLNKVSKISPTLDISEIEVLKDRLYKTYKDTYNEK